MKVSPFYPVQNVTLIPGLHPGNWKLETGNRKLETGNWKPDKQKRTNIETL